MLLLNWLNYNHCDAIIYLTQQPEQEQSSNNNSTRSQKTPTNTLPNSGFIIPDSAQLGILEQYHSTHLYLLNQFLLNRNVLHKQNQPFYLSYIDFAYIPLRKKKTHLVSYNSPLATPIQQHPEDIDIHYTHLCFSNSYQFQMSENNPKELISVYRFVCGQHHLDYATRPIILLSPKKYEHVIHLCIYQHEDLHDSCIDPEFWENETLPENIPEHIQNKNFVELINSIPKVDSSYVRFQKEPFQLMSK